MNCLYTESFNVCTEAVIWLFLCLVPLTLLWTQKYNTIDVLRTTVSFSPPPPFQIQDCLDNLLNCNVVAAMPNIN